MSFQKLGLCEPVLRAVAAEGYAEPTPIQTQAIPHLLAGRDLLGCAQTGTGKTAAFALPILHRLLATRQAIVQATGAKPPGRRPLQALILCPTRELAVQIGDSFAAYGRFSGLRHATIFGGVSQFHQEKALRAGIDIAVATPGRLLDLMQQGHVDLSSVNTFVLDEADRMFDMGFLPSLQRIEARVPRQRQTLLFSATMPPPIEQLAQSILRNPTRLMIAPQRATIDLIQQSVCHVPQASKQPLLEQILGGLTDSRTIVFTRTKHGADRVVKHLDRAGFDSAAIHGNKSQNARQRALEAFKSGRLPVLVATDLAARGIDVDNVTHVINFDLPNEPETYVHRVGRTGRAGASGIAISFCSGDERNSLRDIERLTRQRLRAEVVEGLPTPTRQPHPESQRTRQPQGAATRERPARRLDGPALSSKLHPSGQSSTGSQGKRRRRRRFAAAR